jgi:hypothetical protein
LAKFADIGIAHEYLKTAGFPHAKSSTVRDRLLKVGGFLNKADGQPPHLNSSGACVLRRRLTRDDGTPVQQDPGKHVARRHSRRTNRSRSNRHQCWIHSSMVGGAPVSGAGGGGRARVFDRLTVEFSVFKLERPQQPYPRSSSSRSPARRMAAVWWYLNQCGRLAARQERNRGEGGRYRVQT